MKKKKESKAKGSTGTGQAEVETGTETRSMIVRKVPDDLRREFRVLCVREGVSQQDKVISLMRAAVDEQNKK
jgi:hypothetical protein